MEGLNKQEGESRSRMNDDQPKAKNELEILHWQADSTIRDYTHNGLKLIVLSRL